MPPFLDKIEVQKVGNISGELIARRLAGPPEVRIRFTGSMPISKALSGPATGIGNPPDTIRQHLFEAMCHALRLSNDGLLAPCYFTDSNRQRWSLDRCCAGWLLQTTRWRPTNEDLTDPDLMLEWIGATD